MVFEVFLNFIVKNVLLYSGLGPTSNTTTKFLNQLFKPKQYILITKSTLNQIKFKPKQFQPLIKSKQIIIIIPEPIIQTKNSN